jgi:hypothetical protein
MRRNLSCCILLLPSAALRREEDSMPSTHAKAELPFSPTDLVLRYSLEQHASHLGDAYEAAVKHWHIEVVAEQFDGGGDDPVRWPVGWARVTITALHQGANLYEVFDAIDGDHETVAAALFDPIDGDLSEDLEERYPLILGDILLCDQTWIKAEYRGHKLGLLIKAMSIIALGRGCGIAVTYPAPFEGDHDHEHRDRAIAALGAHWAELGFEHFKNGVWVLDLSAITFQERIDDLLASLR